jgi:hypothetical protein
LERRAIFLRERSIIKPAGFSYSSQITSGQRFTQVSQDGVQVLVVTERKGKPFAAELRGDVYVLNNRTLGLVNLDDCRSPPKYLLQFADFVGADKALVAREFHVYLYTVEGKCLGSFQLQHTKTPVTAVGVC